MKEWKKPFCKVVLLDESDLIATSGDQTTQSLTTDDADVDKTTGGAFSRTPF